MKVRVPFAWRLRAAWWFWRLSSCAWHEVWWLAGSLLRELTNPARIRDDDLLSVVAGRVQVTRPPLPAPRDAVVADIATWTGD